MPLCFVVGAIGAPDSAERNHADWLLEEVIKPAMSGVEGYAVTRADQMAEPGLIDAQVISHLLSAELVIADLSFLNPNAFYEIGIRHMASKPIIHMHQASEKLPFDVSLYRSISFSLTKASHLREAREALTKAVQSVLAEGYVVENPVTAVRGRVKLEETATPEQRVLWQELHSVQSRLATLENRIDEGGSDSFEPVDTGLFLESPRLVVEITFDEDTKQDAAEAEISLLTDKISAKWKRVVMGRLKSVLEIYELSKRFLVRSYVKELLGVDGVFSVKATRLNGTGRMLERIDSERFKKFD